MPTPLSEARNEKRWGGWDAGTPMPPLRSDNRGLRKRQLYCLSNYFGAPQSAQDSTVTFHLRNLRPRQTSFLRPIANTFRFSCIQVLPVRCSPLPRKRLRRDASPARPTSDVPFPSLSLATHQSNCPPSGFFF